MKLSKHFGIFAMLLVGFLLSTPLLSNAQNAVSAHGHLKVNGTKLVDKSNSTVQLQGMSLFWSQWEPEFYTKASLVQLQDEWCTNIVRAAMAIEPEGYLVSASKEEQKIRTVVEAAIDLGMYVIIDWHDHEAHNHKTEAIDFFSRMAEDYGEYPNVIYEIYNEPLSVSWSNTIKPYSEDVIAAIRAKDPDNIIICGTPKWSQDVDLASNDPIVGYDNIMYTLHYYAGTHGASLRTKAETAMNNGIALFVTEFGTVNADGGGAVDVASANTWFDFLDEHHLSYCNWSLCDKNEGSATLKPGTSPSDNFASNLTTAGEFMYNRFKSNCRDYSQINIAPTVEFTSPSNNSTFDENSNIIFTINTSDEDGTIDRVEYMHNNNLIGNSNTHPFSFTWENIEPATYTIKVVAYDNKGEASQPAEITITINQANYDCHGDLNGTASLDECEVCSGGNTGLTPNSTCEQDCNGDWGGKAFIDDCQQCVGGNTEKLSCSREPFNGTPHVIPGKIEAEEFDFGGAEVAYSDKDQINEGGDFRTDEAVDIEFVENSTSNYNVGWTNEGEWLIYSVDVQTSGLYEINFRTASAQNGGAYHIELNDTLLVGMTANNTDNWQSFALQTSTEVKLKTGSTSLKFVIDGGSFNIDFMEFKLLQADAVTASLKTFESVKFHPNPVATILYLDETVNWSIVNSAGMIIKTGFTNTIDVEHLDNGIYHIRTETFSTNFIKE